MILESGFTITAAGWRKLARMVAGDTLHITRVAVGKGVLPEETNPADLTDLVNPVADAASTQQMVNGLEVSFIVEYRNDMNGGLATGFWLTEFGVFVQDGDSEIMLYYATLGDYPEYVSAYGSGRIDVRRYPVAIVLSKELKVELDYPPMAFLTHEEAEPLLTNYTLLRIQHGLGCYPLVELGALRYGAGLGRSGETPAGGTDMEMHPVKVIHHDPYSLSIRTVRPVFQMGSPIVRKLDNCRYIVTFEGNDADSLYIQLLCNAGTVPEIPADVIAVKNMVFSADPPGDTSVIWGAL